MDTRQQATQQSLDKFGQIQGGLNPGKQPSYFDNYFNKGFQLGRFEEKENFFKPVAQFANWAAENIIEAPISAPATLYQGGVDISRGNYYSGTGKILKGGLDIVSIIPIAKAASVAGKVAKGATGLKGAVLKEAGIGGAFGTGYGLSEGLIQAQTARPEDRLGTITRSAGTGGILGATLGGLIPLAGAGAGKTYRYFFPDKVSLPGTKSDTADIIAKSIDNFKTKKETPTVTPISTLRPEIRPSTVELPRVKPGQVKSLKVKKQTPTITPTRDISDQTPRLGRNIVEDNVKAGNLPSISKDLKDKAGRMIDNILAGNDGGASSIIRSTTEPERRRVKQFLRSVYDKGFIPDDAKPIYKNFIDNDMTATYIQKNTAEAKKQASQRINDLNTSQKIGYAQDVLDMYNAKKIELQDAGVAEVNHPRAILAEFINKFPPKGDNNTVIEDYLNAIAADLSASGEAGLSAQLTKVTAEMYTASGQISQGANNSLQNIVRKTEEIFDNMRSKTDKQSYQLIKDASRTINDEFVAVNNQVVNDPSLQQSLFNFQDFFIQSIADALGIKKKKILKDEQVIANAWKKAVESLLPKNDKDEGNSISETILQSILIGKSELQGKGIASKTDPEEALYQRLTYSFDNIDEIAKKVELAKNILRVLISQDPSKLDIAEPIFARMVPEVFITDQADKVYNYIIRDLKPNFRQLATDDNSFKEFKKTIIDEFYNRVQVSEAKGRSMADLIVNKLIARVDNEKLKVKLPGQVVAERIIKDAQKLATTQSEQLEVDVNKMLIELSYQLYKKERNIPADIVEKGVKSLKEDMYKKWRFMLEKPNEFRNILLEAQDTIRKSFPNRVPEVDSILQNYMGRVIGDVFSPSDVTRAAQDQLKKNNISIVDLVKKHTFIQGATMDDLKRSFINDLGVSNEIAEGMATQFTNFINTKADTTRKELINRILTPVIKEQKERASASQKILEYANLGIFDDVKNANVLAEKLKLPNLSEADSKFIGQALSRAQSDPKYSYNDAIRDIGKKLSESNPINLKTGMGRQILFDQYYYNNIFSGFQTQERNIWGSFANGIVYKNALLLGDVVAANILRSGLVPNFLIPENIAGLTKDVKLQNIIDYNKAYFGSVGQAAKNFNKIYTDPNYTPATQSPDIDYYFREYQKKQLPGIIRQVGNFMEATDQFFGTLAEAGELAVGKARGLSDKEAAENAFLLKQEILGRSEFKPYKKGEVGLVDAAFDTIGNFGTKLKGSNNWWNYIATPLFPVLRLAVNFQKLKANLFPPFQLINILTKNPENRTLTDYAYLSVGIASSAFAIDKYTKGEIAFEAPKNEVDKKLFYDSGRKPYSVKIGDSWIPFSYLELFAAPLIYMGAVQAAFQDDPEALTEDDLTKILDANGKFIRAFFISPTYLQVVSKLLSDNQSNSTGLSGVAEFASTGFVPFVGFVKDLVDIIDPIKRKKSETWDEFKALIPDLTIGQFEFKPGLRTSLEPYTTTDLLPTPITFSEKYLPYGIGQNEEKYNSMFESSISTKQEQKIFKEQLKPETERISKAQDELELAFLQKDTNKLVEISKTLTPAQLKSVNERFNKRSINESLSPQERALYGLSADQISTIKEINPEISKAADKVLNFKDRFELPQQGIFDQLKTLTQGYKAPNTKLKGGNRGVRGVRKLRIKKLSKKFTKGFKVKKTKAPKKIKIRPLKKLEKL